MQDAGSAVMGIGSAEGEERAVKAATRAVESPLLETSMEGSRGVLLSISGPSDMSLHEVNQAAQIIAERCDNEANVIFGAVVDDSIGDKVRVTVVAAGFDSSSRRMSRPTSQAVPLPGDDDLIPSFVQG